MTFRPQRPAPAPATALLALLLTGCNIDDFMATTGKGLSTNETVVAGLRAALEVGIDTSAYSASKVNGYLGNLAIRILLPEEAKDALDAAETVGAYIKPFAAELKAIQPLIALSGVSSGDRSSFTSNLAATSTLLADIDGLETIGDSVMKYMNRAAEYAAPRSVPIFKGAITTFTIEDGLSLLNSVDSTAATAYLNGKTFNPLVTAYTPIVDSTLALVPLTKYWGDFRSLYNGILTDYNGLVAFQAKWNANAVVAVLPALQIDALAKTDYQPITTASLGAWTTDKALGGLFWLVGEEEKDIRRDPFGYVKHLAASVSELLKEVFGDIMQMQE